MKRANTGRPASPPPDGGFTLIEMLITLLVVAEILIIAGLLFDLHNKTARAQNDVAGMQQSLRVGQREMVEMVRMAGVGGLPANLTPPPATSAAIVDGVAVQVDNGVAAGTQIVAADPATAVVPGTDVLRVRGVFSTPLYQVLNTALGAPNLVFAPNAQDPATALTGSVVVATPSPAGLRQNLQPLVNAPDDAALLLVSPLSDAIYAVVSVVAPVQVDATDADGNATQVTINFQVVGDTHSAAYRGFFTANGNLPNNLVSAAFVGLLEEHVFYIRSVRAIPGDATSDLQPKLARGQVFPGTAVEVAPGLGTIDVADNVLDLQVALGYNSSADGAFFTRDNLDALVISETANGANDDWLFNGAVDDPSASPWEAIWGDPALGGTPQPELYYLRLTTLVRTEGREFQYISPPIRTLEDRAYNEAMVPAGRDPEREFHRRLLRTVVDLRNL